MQPVEKVVKNIKSVKVQGAKEIAIYALKFLRKFCKKNGFGLKFEVACMILEDARPTAVVLHNCIEILKKKRNLKTIDELIRRLNKTTKQIAKKGSKLIKNNYKIMTHCHSGEALAVIKQAWKEGKKISVIATETDPLEQGVKTAKELAKLKIPVTLITDNAVGYFMKEVDCVLVGADALRANGVVNKIGTSLLALAAKENKKPFYVAANLLKLDKRKKFIIEERPAKEVYQELLRPGKLKGIKIRNPAFDLTEWKFVSAVATEKGILTPKQILGLLK
jgi:ribose 1,5-bisphosphate isomerase